MLDAKALADFEPEVKLRALEVYLHSMKLDFERLAMLSSEPGDREPLRKLSHKIKGASRMVGAQFLVEVAKRVELGVENLDEPEFEKAVGMLQLAGAKLIAELPSYMEGLRKNN